MSSAAMVDSMMFASVVSEAATSPKASSPWATHEPKRAFADTPPLAKIRRETECRQADSADAPVEGEVGNDLAVPCASAAPQESLSPVSEGEPTEGEPKQAAREPGVAPTGQGQAVQVELLTATPSQEATRSTVNAESETVSAEPAISDPDVIPGLSPAIEEVSQPEAGSQGIVNTEAIVALSVAVEPAVTDTTAEDPLNALRAVAPIQGDQGSGKLPGDGDAVTTEARGAQVADIADAGNSPARDSGIDLGNSEANPTIDGKPAASAPIVVENPETDRMQSAQPAAGEDTAGTDRDKSQSEPATSGVAGQNSSDVVPENAPSRSPDNGSTSLESQLQGAATEEQAKTGSFSDVEEGIKVQLDEVADSQGSTAPVAAPATSQVVAPGSQEILGFRSAVQDVGEQILDSVHASLARGDKQLLVRLDPPELGSVMVRFQEREGQILGVLEVSRDQTRQEVEQALPQVLRSLQEAGVLIRRVDVVVADQSDTDADRESSAQDARGRQEGSDQQGPPSEHASATRWPRWAAQQHLVEFNEAVGPKAGGVPGRIDMLI